MRPRCRDDTGAATLWTVGAIAAVFVVVVAAILLATATVTRHRATSAADLAALAAAAHAESGEPAACARARWVIDRMHAGLVRCRLVGWDAYVELTVRPPGILGDLGRASARARAGPVAP